MDKDSQGNLPTRPNSMENAGTNNKRESTCETTDLLALVHGSRRNSPTDPKDMEHVGTSQRTKVQHARLENSQPTGAITN